MPRLVAIDLLRFASALLVVAVHYANGFIIPAGPDDGVRVIAAPPSMLSAPASSGWVGVELFFVISGYVIARSGTGRDWRSFVRRRALRLVPAAWICATATALGAVALGWTWGIGAGWLATVAFWPFATQIDPVYWTLGVEVAFYLAIASALGEAGTGEAIGRRAALIGTASALFWAMVPLAGVAPALTDLRPIVLLLLPHGCLFALGVTVAGAAARGWTLAALARAAAFYAAAAVEIHYHPLVVGRPPAFAVPFLIFTAGVLLLAAAPRLQSHLERLPLRTSATLGLMTYPLYLIHHRVGGMLTAKLMDNGWSYRSAMALVVPAALAFSFIVARVAEPALRRALGRMLAAVVAVRRHALLPDNPRTASPPAG